MSNAYTRALLCRDAGVTKRFHVLRSNRVQTVAEHTYGVCMLITVIHPGCSATLLQAALHHDSHEHVTGDAPSTAKWRFPQLAEAMQAAEDEWNAEQGLRFDLTTLEESILKFCDYAELLFWALEELEMGNRFAARVVNNIYGVLTKLEPPTPQAKELMIGLRLRVQDNAKEH